MSRPKDKEVLFAYIAVALHAVRLVLIRVDDRVQRRVYFGKKSLHEAEVCYLPLEKAILTVIHATQKLPHHFQAHIIVVLTQLPLQLLLRKANYTRKIAKLEMIIGALISSICLAPPLKAKSLWIWWLISQSLQWKKIRRNNAWMKNQLVWPPCKSLHFGGYILMMQ